MRTEVEKMYARAMVKPLSITVCGVDEQIINYPPFTAEKQLELIKWLAKRLDFGLEYYHDKWVVQTQLGWDCYEEQFEHRSFDEALSGFINHLWKELTEEEKQQIREILE